MRMWPQYPAENLVSVSSTKTLQYLSQFCLLQGHGGIPHPLVGGSKSTVEWRWLCYAASSKLSSLTWPLVFLLQHCIAVTLRHKIWWVQQKTSHKHTSRRAEMFKATALRCWKIFHRTYTTHAIECIITNWQHCELAQYCSLHGPDSWNYNVSWELVWHNLRIGCLTFIFAKKGQRY